MEQTVPIRNRHHGKQRENLTSFISNWILPDGHRKTTTLDSWMDIFPPSIYIYKVQHKCVQTNQSHCANLMCLFSSENTTEEVTDIKAIVLKECQRVYVLV